MFTLKNKKIFYQIIFSKYSNVFFTFKHLNKDILILLNQIICILYQYQLLNIISIITICNQFLIVGTKREYSILNALCSNILYLL